MATAEQYAQWIVANKDKKGTPEFDTVAKAYQMAKSQQPRSMSVQDIMQRDQQPEGYDPTGSFGQNLLAGAGKAFVDVGRGAVDMFGDAVQAISPEGSPLLPWHEKNNQAIAEARQRDAPLMDTGGGLVGNIAGNLAVAAPSIAVPGANTAAGAGLLGATMGALNPTLGDESRTANAGVGLAAGAAGQKLANTIGAKLAARPAQEASRKAQNVVRDEIVDEAMKAGYKLPPVAVNPGSKAAQVAEGVSGKLMTQQTAAVKNQAVTNKLAKQALGFADDAPLTESALSQARKASGAVYDEVGKAVDSFKVDAKFTKATEDALSDYRALRAEFPEMANKSLDQLEEILGRQEFSGKNMLRLVRQIRKEAKANYKAFDNPEKLDLARAQSKSAKALEDLIERHLENVDPSLMSRFKSARANIAKSHAVESAMDEAGNVDAHKIAKMLEKGEPLSGELKTIGRVAKQFRDATRLRTDSVNQWTLPTIAGAAYGAGSGNPAMLALALSRPAVRAGLLSSPGQKLLAAPKYGGKAAGKAGKALKSSYGGLLGRALPPALVGSSQ